MIKPYTEVKDGSVILREFAETVSDDELVWHQDEQDRVITPVECEGWVFQRDNERPSRMEPNQSFVVEKYTYHRIIKGSGKLKLRITEG